MTFNGFGSQATWPDGSSLMAEGGISKGRTAIRDLCQGMTNCILVGLVISKQEVHSFPDRKNPGGVRCHFFFTLRDSSIDFINVNCWGSESFIGSLAQSFKINDVVEVSNPRIQNKQTGEAEHRWRPWTPSPYQLHISEPHSAVSMFSGWDMAEFDNISHMPIKASNDFYTLGDIIANDQNLHGEHVNIQAVVKCVGNPKGIVTKTGKHVKRCEVILFDETCPCFPLVIWEKESIDLAQTWVPKDIDVKVTFDDFKKCMIATCDHKTIITANPNTMEARYLYNYAQSLEYLDDEPINSFESSMDSINLDNIKDIFTLRYLKQTMTEPDKLQPLPTFGIVYAFVTSFDIDNDTKKFIAARCAVCNQRVDALSETCLNPECVTSANPEAQQAIKIQYELAVSLSDHTGTIENCRLTEKCAENMFECKAVDVLQWTQPQLTEIKIRILLERCKMYFKVTTFSQPTGHVKGCLRLLSCAPADPKEVAQFCLNAT